MRANWSDINNRIENLQELNIEINELTIYASLFNNSCILKIDLKRNLSKLFEAKSYFLNCLNILKGIIDYEDNELITEYKMRSPDVQDELDKYFENFLSKLDGEQKKLLDYLEDSRIAGELIIPSAMKMFAEELKDGMKNIILYPLCMATKIYSEKDFEKKETKISKKETFRYILFRCVLVSAKIKGSEKRYKTSLSSLSTGTNLTEIKNIRQGRQIIRPEIKEEKEETDDFDDLFMDEEVHNAF